MRCAIRKFDKHSTADRPSNTVLQQEHQKSMNELLQIREQQDKGIFQPIELPGMVLSVKEDKTYTSWKHPLPIKCFI
jgi:hypothetical protein